MTQEPTNDEWFEATEEAKELGAQWAPDHICSECIEIEIQPETDEKLKEIAGWELDEPSKPFFRQPPNPPTEKHRFLFNDVFSSFRHAVYDECPPPSECDVCLDENTLCGHVRHAAGPCPAEDT